MYAIEAWHLNIRLSRLVFKHASVLIRISTTRVVRRISTGIRPTPPAALCAGAVATGSQRRQVPAVRRPPPRMGAAETKLGHDHSRGRRRKGRPDPVRSAVVVLPLVW